MKIKHLLLGLFFLTSGVVLADDISPPAGVAITQLQDEGTNLARRSKLNFIGSAIACVDNSVLHRIDCTVTASGAGGGSSSVAVGTGTASNFTNNVSSPTAAISFLGTQFNSLAIGTTNFIKLAPSLTLASLSVSTLTVTSSATFSALNSIGNIVGVQSITGQNIFATNGITATNLISAPSFSASSDFTGNTGNFSTTNGGHGVFSSNVDVVGHISISTSSPATALSITGGGTFTSSVTAEGGFYGDGSHLILVSSFPVSGVSPGVFTSANVTVNPQGFITSIASGATGGGVVNSGTAGQNAYYAANGTSVSGSSNMITNLSSETFNVTTVHSFGLSASTATFSLPVTLSSTVFVNGRVALANYPITGGTIPGVYSAGNNLIGINFSNASSMQFQEFQNAAQYSAMTITPTEIDLATTTVIQATGNLSFQNSSGNNAQVYSNPSLPGGIVISTYAKTTAGYIFPDNTIQTTAAAGSSGAVNAGTAGQNAYYAVSGTTVSGSSNMITNISSETFNVTTNHLFGLSSSTGVFSSNILASSFKASATGSVGTPAYALSDGAGILGDGAQSIRFETSGAQDAKFDSAGNFQMIATGAQIQANDGTPLAAGLSYGSDVASGINRMSAGTLGIDSSGVIIATFSSVGESVKSITVFSTATVTGRLFLQDGSAANPSWAWGSNSNTGGYKIGANEVGISAGGTSVIEISNAKFISSDLILAPDGTPVAPSYTFGSDQMTGLEKPGSGQIGVVSGGVAIATFSSTGLTVGGLVGVTGKIILSTDSAHLAPTITGCGTSPVIGFGTSDTAGTVTPGSTAAGCTVTFGTAFANKPSCVVTEQTMSLVNVLAYTESTTALVVSQTAFTSAFDWHCIGH